MKAGMMIVGAAASFVGLSGTAHAQDAGWYLRGELGGSVENEFEANDIVDVENGVAASLAIGFSFNGALRAEGELLYLQNDLEGGSGGDTSSIGGFANVIYDFNRMGTIQPFLGVGVGYSRVDIDGGSLNGDDAGFAYQAKAGFAYQINDRLNAELVYRYVVVPDMDFGSRASGLNGDFDSQAITIGLRWKLD